MIPVSPGREAWFLALFLVHYGVGMVLLGGMYWAGWLGGIGGLEALRLIAPLIVASTAHGILIVEGVPMVAEQFLRRREERGEKRGREQGLEQGREQGLEQGRQEIQQRWQAWNQRRLRAQQEGREFNEPHPKVD